MIDIHFIDENLSLIEENVKKRNMTVDLKKTVSLYHRKKFLQTSLIQLQEEKNTLARQIAQTEVGQRAILIEKGKSLRQKISSLEKEITAITEKMTIEMKKIPNLHHPLSPAGSGDTAAVELRRWGKIPEFTFSPRDHLELAGKNDLIDFERAAVVSGQKFFYLKKEAVLLELALIRYAIDFAQKWDFTPMSTPDIARKEIVEGLGYNPRGKETNIYNLEDNQGCLIGTAEIPLGGYLYQELLDRDKLPVRLAGISHCFRRESGAAGQYSKGLYRVHQFTKVELFVFCLPEHSEEEHLRLVDLEEHIFRSLEIPYRVVECPISDLGAPAYRKIDLEAWMPGRQKNGGWGEITSASNCTDYQARRLNIRYRDAKQNRYVHTLNGTGIATSRTLIALMENMQQEDFSIRIPSSLVPYTGFKKIG